MILMQNDKNANNKGSDSIRYLYIDMKQFNTKDKSYS